MDKIAILKRTDLFYNLTQDQLELIAAIARERHTVQGEVIFEAGSHSREIFVIVQGSIEVSHKNYNDSEQDKDDGGGEGDDGGEDGDGDTDPARTSNPAIVQAILSQGQSFGEIAFIDKATREASTKSLSDDTVLLSIDPEQLMAQCEANPAMGFLIVRNIAKDLAFIIRELDLHILGEQYWDTPAIEYSEENGKETQ